MEEYMNSALERFFNKIEFTQKEAFKDVSVEKVVVNNKKQTGTVYLKTNTPISDIKALYDLINLAHEGLEEVFDISILINCDTVSEDDITNYFKFWFFFYDDVFSFLFNFFFDFGSFFVIYNW